MKKSKKSWEYQKGKYKQLNIKFNLENDYDAAIHHYLTCGDMNASRLIKDLLYNKLEEEAFKE